MAEPHSVSDNKTPNFQLIIVCQADSFKHNASIRTSEPPYTKCEVISRHGYQTARHWSRHKLFQGIDHYVTSDITCAKQTLNILTQDNHVTCTTHKMFRSRSLGHYIEDSDFIEALHVVEERLQNREFAFSTNDEDLESTQQFNLRLQACLQKVQTIAAYYDVRRSQNEVKKKKCITIGLICDIFFANSFGTFLQTHHNAIYGLGRLCRFMPLTTLIFDFTFNCKLQVYSIELMYKYDYNAMHASDGLNEPEAIVAY